MWHKEFLSGSPGGLLAYHLLYSSKLGKIVLRNMKQYLWFKNPIEMEVVSSFDFFLHIAMFLGP